MFPDAFIFEIIMALVSLSQCTRNQTAPSINSRLNSTVEVSTAYSRPGLNSTVEKREEEKTQFHGGSEHRIFKTWTQFDGRKEREKEKTRFHGGSEHRIFKTWTQFDRRKERGRENPLILDSIPRWKSINSRLNSTVEVSTAYSRPGLNLMVEKREEEKTQFHGGSEHRIFKTWTQFDGRKERGRKNPLILDSIPRWKLNSTVEVSTAYSRPGLNLTVEKREEEKTQFHGGSEHRIFKTWTQFDGRKERGRKNPLILDSIPRWKLNSTVEVSTAYSRPGLNLTVEKREEEKTQFHGGSEHRIFKTWTQFDGRKERGRKNPLILDSIPRWKLNSTVEVSTAYSRPGLNLTVEKREEEKTQFHGGSEHRIFKTWTQFDGRKERGRKKPLIPDSIPRWKLNSTVEVSTAYSRPGLNLTVEKREEEKTQFHGGSEHRIFKTWTQFDGSKEREEEKTQFHGGSEHRIFKTWTQFDGRKEREEEKTQFHGGSEHRIFKTWTQFDRRKEREEEKTQFHGGSEHRIFKTWTQFDGSKEREEEKTQFHGGSEHRIFKTWTQFDGRKEREEEKTQFHGGSEHRIFKTWTQFDRRKEREEEKTQFHGGSEHRIFKTWTQFDGRKEREEEKTQFHGGSEHRIFKTWTQFDGRKEREEEKTQFHGGSEHRIFKTRTQFDGRKEREEEKTQFHGGSEHRIFKTWTQFDGRKEREEEKTQFHSGSEHRIFKTWTQFDGRKEREKEKTQFHGGSEHRIFKTWTQFNGRKERGREKPLIPDSIPRWKLNSTVEVSTAYSRPGLNSTVEKREEEKTQFHSGSEHRIFKTWTQFDRRKERGREKPLIPDSIPQWKLNSTVEVSTAYSRPGLNSTVEKREEEKTQFHSGSEHRIFMTWTQFDGRKEREEEKTQFHGGSEHRIFKTWTQFDRRKERGREKPLIPDSIPRWKLNSTVEVSTAYSRPGLNLTVEKREEEKTQFHGGSEHRIFKTWTQFDRRKERGREKPLILDSIPRWKLNSTVEVSTAYSRPGLNSTVEKREEEKTQFHGGSEHRIFKTWTQFDGRKEREEEKTQFHSGSEHRIFKTWTQFDGRKEREEEKTQFHGGSEHRIFKTWTQFDRRKERGREKPLILDSIPRWKLNSTVEVSTAYSRPGLNLTVEKREEEKTQFHGGSEHRIFKTWTQFDRRKERGREKPLILDSIPRWKLNSTVEVSTAYSRPGLKLTVEKREEEKVRYVSG
ncbi:unnamed protein product [Caenorhabditis nigoni]